MQFEWDADKAGSNERKHGISFVEGITVFDDAYAITIADPLPSIAEDRYIDILGIRAEAGCWSLCTHSRRHEYALSVVERRRTPKE
jgi:uncharacterized DUF497 family protein